MSLVSICNRALTKIGDDFTITSINDDVKSARLCKALYAQTRDYVLRSYPWRFALKLWELAPLAEKPLYGYKNAFQIPADCLSVWMPQNPQIRYEVMGKTVYADTELFRFKGIRRIEDVNLFDVMFIDALALRLAYEFVPVLTGDMNLKNMLIQEYELRVKEARHASAIEGMPETFYISPSWVTEHLGA